MQLTTRYPFVPPGSEKLRICLSARSNHLPGGEAKQSGNDEKSSRKKIECPVGHRHSIDTHPTYHQINVIANVDRREISENAKPNASPNASSPCEETGRSGYSPRQLAAALIVHATFGFRLMLDLKGARCKSICKPMNPPITAIGRAKQSPV